MSIQDADIPGFVETTDSLSGSIGDKSEIVKKYLCPYSVLPQVVTFLLPFWARTTGSDLVYYPGDQLAEQPYFYCYQVSFKVLAAPPQDGSPMWDGTKSQWDTAEITATYRVPSFDPKGDVKDMFELDLEFAAEEMLIPGGSYKDGSGNIVSDPVRKIIPTIALNITLFDRPQLPGGDATAIMNVTAAPMNTNPFLGAAAKKLLFIGCHTSRTTTSQGPKGWKITYKMLYRPYEWDKVFVAQNGTFSTVTAVNGAGDPLYGDSDYTPLFKL